MEESAVKFQTIRKKILEIFIIIFMLSASAGILFVALADEDFFDRPDFHAQAALIPNTSKGNLLDQIDPNGEISLLYVNTGTRSGIGVYGFGSSPGADNYGYTGISIGSDEDNTSHSCYQWPDQGYSETTLKVSDSLDLSAMKSLYSDECIDQLLDAVGRNGHEVVLLIPGDTEHPFRLIEDRMRYNVGQFLITIAWENDRFRIRVTDTEKKD